MDQREREYLTPGRLLDVLTLIQVLGYGSEMCLTALGVCVELQDVDESRQPSEERVQHWACVARSHPEFFRVSGKSVSISLVARFVARKTDAAQQLPPETVQKLMAAAIELHDRQVRRNEQWALYVPLWVAGIAGVGSILTAVLALLTRG